MGRAKKVLEQIGEPIKGINSDSIKLAFEQRLDKLGFEGITVEDVEADIEGDIIVTFADDDGDELDVLFTVDEDDGAIAILLDDEDEDGEDITIIDLDPSLPVIRKTILGEFIDLTNLDFLNRSLVTALFKAGDLDDEDNDIRVDVVQVEGIEEQRKISVIRGGKRVKLGIVRKRKKVRLSAKQKSGIRKGVRKRKARKAAIQRKRKKSLKIRKRLKLKKKPKGTKFKR